MRMQLKLAVFALLAGCATARAPSSIAVGDSIDFELSDLKGARVSSRSMRGKVVLLDLWATWCEPCKVSMPFYADLAKQYENEGFAVFAISVDVHQDEVERFVENQALPFTVLRDPEGSIPRKIGIAAMPTMLLLGRDGKIVYLHTGFLPSDRDAITAEVVRAVRTGTTTSTST
jgi:cytochrome c biogenesis protein CcmG, thiol:disulfide interchange protein DsbE